VPKDQPNKDKTQVHHVAADKLLKNTVYDANESAGIKNMPIEAENWLPYWLQVRYLCSSLSA
jgi:hypothetical protein